jgi:hypothetical protein
MIIHHTTYSIEDDPRNDEDYDTWELGMEPLPNDHTWRSASVDVDVSPSTGDVADR